MSRFFCNYEKKDGYGCANKVSNEGERCWIHRDPNDGPSGQELEDVYARIEKAIKIISTLEKGFGYAKMVVKAVIGGLLSTLESIVTEAHTEYEYKEAITRLQHGKALDEDYALAAETITRYMHVAPEMFKEDLENAGKDTLEKLADQLATLEQYDAMDNEHEKSARLARIKAGERIIGNTGYSAEG